MENSLRHGEHVTRVDFSVKETDNGLILTYADNGVGITKDDKKKLFLKGFGKHTGLGLFLSKEILSITGITITETSEPGKGARFEMTVPKEAWRMTEVDRKG
jgi:signal transduction histidine kinase